MRHYANDLGLVGAMMGFWFCLMLSIAAINASHGMQWALDLCQNPKFLYSIVAGQFLSIVAMCIAIAVRIRP